MTSSSGCLDRIYQGTADQVMNEHIAPKTINFRVVKLSNSLAITCVPRLDLNGPTLRHFEP